MHGMPEKTLPELLVERKPDACRIIDTFISRYNASYGNAGSACWDITKEEWQRYEFLGDRVLSLIVAQILFTRRGSLMSEGEMTQILSSAVSNQSLDAIARGSCRGVFSRLIPPSIGEQNRYGERITGGAFEAFIGALYCEAGFDDVACFISALMEEALDGYDPQENAIGILQEYYQKNGMPVPVYDLIASTGPAHKPFHTYRVRTPDGGSFLGEGHTSAEARQKAARAALGEIQKRETPAPPPGGN
jgi:ribonuclease-3